MGEDTTYDIEELASLAGMTARNVRAYRTRGLLPAPRRRGRTARYGEEHLDRLREVARLREAGIPLRLITELAQQGADLGPESGVGRLARERLRTGTVDLREPAPGELDLRRADRDGTWSPLAPELAGHLETDARLHGRLLELGVVAADRRPVHARPGVTDALHRCAELGLPAAVALGLALVAAEHADRLAGGVNDVCGETPVAASASLQEAVVRLAAGIAEERVRVTLAITQHA